ncbi:1-deoxy-D-xylulose-5-phosphate synthase N-terminal domain-containing protein [Solirubrobacter soli]|uniref:1-deoxy-D-xylulose-5-phosphate synthase N-terminal domain-containing protein n=1 Tax=Solirubrobacter soli TaxID=363832 RepID=UPI00041AFE34|nr:1-deoxy-D-xylulose-5-phosphate synthase N-terminal domain-containing protein [Solirubrobacter soli]
MEAATFAANAPIALTYVPPAELARIRETRDPVTRAAALADANRINALSSIMEAGSGHIGTSFSVADILAWLHLEVLTGDDVCFSSKGHDAPAVYAALASVGKLDFELLHKLRKGDGLPGHPDIHATPQVFTNTGSLGMGVSKAKGFARAARLDGGRRRVFVITGDGELQEGQFWESLSQAANEDFGEITVIVDHNKIQSDTWVEHVNDLGDLEAKGRAFGWAVARCDGNDMAALSSTLTELLEDLRPKLLIADTVKGAGAEIFTPHALEKSGTALYAYHSGAPSEELYGIAIAELVGKLADTLGRDPELEAGEAPRRVAPQTPQKLVDAYGSALKSAADRREDIVALDADLYLDCGLIPFRGAHPGRFVECGIAEMDMVSQAGALALGGKLPVVHSFACFLTPRANEQIYNNASEGTKVIYGGFLAGIVPGGPGHSHQSVRDIALMGSVPGMTCLEPFSMSEAARCVEYAVDEATGPVYLRFVSVPWELGFEPPEAAPLQRGRGTVLRADGDVVLVTTGPVLVSQAYNVSEVALVALPWLRDVDGAWLAEIAGGRRVVVLDNHVLSGGQGDAVRAALPGHAVEVFGIDRVPAGGTNDEVLRAHGLDTHSLRERLR